MTDQNLPEISWGSCGCGRQWPRLKEEIGYLLMCGVCRKTNHNAAELKSEHLQVRVVGLEKQVVQLEKVIVEAITGIITEAEAA